MAKEERERVVSRRDFLKGTAAETGASRCWAPVFQRQRRRPI